MKPRLYDPRTGYRVDARGHRALMKYAERQIARYDAAAQDAADHAERLRRRSSRVAWMAKAERRALRLLVKHQPGGNHENGTHHRRGLVRFQYPVRRLALVGHPETTTLK